MGKKNGAVAFFDVDGTLVWHDYEKMRAMSAEERKFIFDVINFLWQQTRSIFFHPRT